MPNLNSIRFCKTRQISLLIILFVLQTNNLIQAQRTQQQKEFIQSLNLTPEESEWLNNNYIIKVHPDSWPPFNYWDMRTGTNQGICIEYLRWIAIKTGIQFEFPAMWMPFKHILPALEHKQLDLSPSIHKTTERENYLLYSKPIHPVEIWLFAASNEQYSPDLLRQPGIRITCEDQTKTHEYLSATYPNLIIIPTITEEDGLRKVISHEADFHAGSKSVCNYLIKNYYGLNNLTEIHRLEFPSQGIYMAAREDWPELISIINKSLDQLPASTKDEIIDKLHKPN